jgi:hypothetical protein
MTFQVHQRSYPIPPMEYSLMSLYTWLIVPMCLTGLLPYCWPVVSDLLYVTIALWNWSVHFTSITFDLMLTSCLWAYTWRRPYTGTSLYSQILCYIINNNHMPNMHRYQDTGPWKSHDLDLSIQGHKGHIQYHKWNPLIWIITMCQTTWTCTISEIEQQVCLISLTNLN